MKDRDTKGEAKQSGKRQRARWLAPSRRLLIGVGVVVAVATVVAIALLPRLVPPPPPVDTLPISELLNRAEQHQIAEVVIVGDLVKATTRTGYHFQSVKESGSTLTNELRRDGVAVVVKDTADESPSLTSLLALIVLFTIGGLAILALRKGGVGGTLNSFGRSNARLLTDRMPPVTFADVAGVEEAKLELQEIVHFLRDPGRFRILGARAPKGILLVGPPGTGKTLISKAVAGEAGVPFFSISGSEFVEMFVGVGASRVRDLFDQAKRNSPCIVFVDEIDAVGRQRGAGLGGSHDEREQTLNQILVEMDGFDTNTNVIVVAATNRPDVLDPALLRPGRFDRQVILDRPDMKGRLEILKVHVKGKPLDKAIDLPSVARSSPGFSGADLANLVNEAAILAARRNKKVITTTEFGEALERVVAGPERKSRIISDAEKAIIAYHEGGHAVVQRILPKCDPVNKVTIISRGMALGYTMALPSEDRYLQSKTEFEDKIAGLLGGNAAERLIFGDTTTGASNDIEKATDLARRMVTEFGMSDKLGPLSFGKRDELVFLGREIGEQRNYSDDVAKQIDEEVRAIIDRGYARAMDVLTRHKDRLVKLAEVLVAEESIEREQFEALFADIPDPRREVGGGPTPKPLDPSFAPKPAPAPVPAPASKPSPQPA